MRMPSYIFGLFIILSTGVGLALADDGDGGFRQKCPAGTQAYGKPPPEGKQIWCRQPVPGGYIRQGRYVAYHRNGKKKVQGNFEQNKPHGAWISYDRFGQKVKETDYYDGKIVNKIRFDKKGKPVEGDPKDQRKDKSKKKQEDLTDWSGHNHQR